MVYVDCTTEVNICEHYTVFAVLPIHELLVGNSFIATCGCLVTMTTDICCSRKNSSCVIWYDYCEQRCSISIISFSFQELIIFTMKLLWKWFTEIWSQKMVKVLLFLEIIKFDHYIYMYLLQYYKMLKRNIEWNFNLFEHAVFLFFFSGDLF